jgi:MFS family permease
MHCYLHMVRLQKSNTELNSAAISQKESVGETNWITIVILGSTLLITMYSETMLLPGITDIIKEFNISYNASSWILSAYLIAGAVATPIAGKLSDIYGRKKMILIILLIYIVGISLGGLSSSITFLILARVIQGIGISIFPIALGMIRNQLSNDKLAIGVGIFSSMFAAGSVVGLAVGSNIVENFGWRTTFFSTFFIVIALWLVIKRAIHDGQDSKDMMPLPRTKIAIRLDNGNRDNEKTKITKILDIKGAITLAFTITSFLLVISYSQISNTMGSILVPTFLILGTVSLASFIFTERKSENPLINLKLMTNKRILFSNIILIVSFLSLFTIFQTIPVLVRSPPPIGFGGNAITSADIQLPFMIVFLIFAPSSGFVISKVGSVKPTIIGSFVSTIGFIGLFMFHSTGFLIAINLAIIAAGISLMRVGGYEIILKSTPKQFSGISLGMTVLFNLTGASIGPAIAGIYMQGHQVIVRGFVGAFPSEQSYTLIFLTLVLISFVTIILSVFLRKKATSLPTLHDLSI